MPVYKYLVINKSNAPEYIEIEQEVNDPPLSIHPVTSEPIKRVLTSPTLTLKIILLPARKRYYLLIT